MIMSRPSLWTKTKTIPSFEPLPEGLVADVAVVGGGIAGVTAALMLQRANVKVVLIEANRVGAGETGHTTAHLTELIDARYHVLESKFGRQGAQAAASSCRAALDRIEAWVSELAISCGFARVPEFLYAETADQLRELEQEFESLQRVGIEAAWVDAFPLPLAVQGAIRLENQGQFHPLCYLAGLVRAFVAAGGQIFEQTRMLEVEDGNPCRVVTDRGVIEAQQVLVLAHVPSSNKVALHTKLAAYRTYAISLPLDAQDFPVGLFSDLQDPYHYIRTQETPAGTFFIVGGEDHKTGKPAGTDDPWASLETYASNLLPGSVAEDRWSGQIIETADGLPFIGKNPGSERIYVGTGFSGMGMTFGTLCAMMLADAVLEIESPWADLYSPTRFKPLAQVHHYVSESIDFPVALAHDRVATGQVDRQEEIPPGEGRLMRVEGKMLAVFRDAEGSCHARSAVCTHLGCYVRWNDHGKSWDCPCHGSRFDVEGGVLNGPAVKSLHEAPSEAAAALGQGVSDAG